VTAGVGVTAYAGLCITHRDAASAVAFVTGHDQPGASASRVDWDALARFPGTLVVYMGVAHLRPICEALMRGGKSPSTPAALVQSGTMPWQRTLVGTLADLADRAHEAGLAPPALIVVGEVVAHRPHLSWFENLPLFGLRVLLTRPEEEGRRAADDLEALGAEVLLAPTVLIRPVADPGQMDRAIDSLNDFEWLVFTSANGVRYFLERIQERGRDLRVLGAIRLAAIGPGTARSLEAYHLRPDVVPDEYRSEALAQALAQHVRGRRVLLARADRGRTILREQLAQVASVTQVAVYSNQDAESLPADVQDRLVAGSIDWITLTSSAIAERLAALLPLAARDWVGTKIRLASLSPVTSAAAANQGWTVAAEAQTYTWPGLIDAIVADVRRSVNRG
jgi:uroporphyrinogen III methyltransferase/synthase